MSVAHNYRIKAARFIAMRGFRAALYGPGVYLVATVSCILAAIVTSTYVGTIKEEGLLTISSPLSLPLYLAITAGAVYLAITASVSISRERDSGTLEVLFYGPVDAVSYIIAKFLEQVLIFTVMLLFFIVAFLIFGKLTNFGFSSDIVLSVMLSLGLASSVSAFGIFLSSITSRIRISILILVALLFTFLGIGLGESLLSGLDPKAVPPTLFYARSFLSVAAKAVGWISPFAYMSRGMQAIAVWNMPGYVMSFVCSLVYSIVLLGLSVLSLRRRGVRG